MNKSNKLKDGQMDCWMERSTARLIDGMTYRHTDRLKDRWMDKGTHRHPGDSLSR